jgi:uncharacterized Tic20 family protein
VSSFETPPPSDELTNQVAPANAAFVPPALVSGRTAPTPDDRTLAMLAELLQLFSWIIGPAIIFFVKRDSLFVRFHALQAILWQVAMMMFSIVFIVVVIAIAVAAPKAGGNLSGLPVVFMLGFYALFGLFSLANMVIAIYFAIQANSGAWASYPLIGRAARRILGI